MKRTSLPVPVSKIDKKLEQYTHALEVSWILTLLAFFFCSSLVMLRFHSFVAAFVFQTSSKENRSGTPVLTELAAAAEPVSSRKSLFEGGEAWNQNSTSVAPSKVRP